MLKTMTKKKMRMLRRKRWSLVETGSKESKGFKTRKRGYT
jgi:hypothetical protein